MRFSRVNQIDVLWYSDQRFSYRLNECVDAPLVLYCKGNVDLNASKILAVVGSRSISTQAKLITQKIVQDLSVHKELLIVSGLAYGIDIEAQKSAYQHKLSTVGVLAGGLDHVYPKDHQSFAQKIIQNGGMLSEMPQKTKILSGLFPKRNRIVAGLSDAVLVIESKVNGGAMITANLANGYDRDVLAVPTAINNQNNGTNNLIKTHRAQLVESAEDVASVLQLNNTKNEDTMLQLNVEEEKIVQHLKSFAEPQHLQDLQVKFSDQVLLHLFNLESKDLIVNNGANYYFVK